MKRWCAIAALAAAICGCGGDSDDVAEIKKPMPLDQVPAAALKAAKESAPELTFVAANRSKFEGKDCIELRGKTKSGQIKEVEVTDEGKVLGIE